MSVIDDAFARWAGRALTLVAVLRVISFGTVPARADPDSIATMVARVTPAVVTIISIRPPQPEDDKPGVKVASTPATGRPSTAIGSGFIIDPSGFIATNRQLIEGSTALLVMTFGGIRYPAAFAVMANKADIPRRGSTPATNYHSSLLATATKSLLATRSSPFAVHSVLIPA